MFVFKGLFNVQEIKNRGLFLLFKTSPSRAKIIISDDFSTASPPTEILQENASWWISLDCNVGSHKVKIRENIERKKYVSHIACGTRVTRRQSNLHAALSLCPSPY